MENWRNVHLPLMKCHVEKLKVPWKTLQLSPTKKKSKRPLFSVVSNLVLGTRKPFITLSQKGEFFRCIALHHVISVSLSELEQFIHGLSNCNLLLLICSNPEAFRMIFDYSNQLLVNNYFK